MTEDKSANAQPPSPQEPAEGGVQIGGQQVSVGGDVAGHDIVRTTHVGFSPEAVQKMVITVGVLVFITAACFFSGGVVVGSAAIVALDRKVGSSIVAANRMQAKLEAVQSLPAGQRFRLTFTEDEISSYVRFIAGPQIGLTDGKVRLLDATTLVVGGRVSSLGNLPVAATFELQDITSEPLRLKAAAIQLVQLRNTTFGWVSVPTAVLEPFAQQLNQFIGGTYQLTGATISPDDPSARTVTGVAR